VVRRGDAARLGDPLRVGRGPGAGEVAVRRKGLLLRDAGTADVDLVVLAFVVVAVRRIGDRDLDACTSMVAFVVVAVRRKGLIDRGCWPPSVVTVRRMGVFKVAVAVCATALADWATALAD